MRDFINDLYEAALLGDRWPDLLEAIGKAHGSGGAMIFANTSDGTRFTASEQQGRYMAEFVDAGWMEHNVRVPRLIASGYTGFVTDLDVMTRDEIDNSPMYQEFLLPRGGVSAAATHISGAENDGIIFSVEGFPSHEAARAAVQHLDALRPHLARSVMLSSRLSLERAKGMTQALQAIGVPAAVINSRGIVRSVNSLFEPFIGRTVFDGVSGISLDDAAANRLMQTTLARLKTSPAGARSIPLPAAEDEDPGILHFIPVAGEARDLFTSGSLLLVVTGVGERRGLGGTLLQTLFDLTPAEAQLAVAFAGGKRLNDIAVLTGKSVLTVRTQFKAILAKTGKRSQRDLLELLNRMTIGSHSAS